MQVMPVDRSTAPLILSRSRTGFLVDGGDDVRRPPAAGGMGDMGG
jgi:hypothetical protein